MAETIINLVAGHGRNIDFLYKYRKNDLSYIFDTRIIKRSLRDVPITDPEVLSFLKKEIIKGQKALEKRRIK
jgi:hypothetical protein